jgi:P2-related tail formation protein
MGNILATGISNVEHLKVFDQIAEERFAELDLSVLLIYMIDTVPAAALPVLGEQFDLLGYKGWNFVDADEAQQRELIKSAIELHRYKGTPWSIKEALRRIGFGGAEIIEGVGEYHDGTFYRNGLVRYNGAYGWANFRVIFDLGNVKGISAEQTADLQALIAEYKNVRSHLVDLAFAKNIEEQVTIGEEVEFTIGIPDISDSFVPYHNGEFRRNGTILYAAYTEEVPIIQEIEPI